MSNIAQSSPCVELSIIHECEDSREPTTRRNSEVQSVNDNFEAYLELLNDDSEKNVEPTCNGSDRCNSEVQPPNDNSDACIKPLSDNSESSIEPTCNGSENNVVSSNSDFYDRLKPTRKNSGDYLQLIKDDHNYLQPTNDLPNTSSLRRTREDAGSCLHAASESEAHLQPVESGLHSYRQAANERLLCTNDHIRPNNISYDEQTEYDQIVDEYDEIDVAMVGFQPLDNTRSRSQQCNSPVCDDLHTESSFESTSREQPRHVQDVILPADERPAQLPAMLKVGLSLVVFGLGVLVIIFVLNLLYAQRALAENEKTAAVNNNKVAFYIGTSHNTLPPNSLNNAFNKILTDVNSPLNLTTGMLSSLSQPGIYWFQLSAGVPANTGAIVSLNGLTYPVVIYSTATNYPDDVMVADTIQTVNTLQRLIVTNETPLKAASDTNMAVSLVGYRLDNIMDTTSQVTFAVQLTYDIRSTAGIADTLVVFDRVLVNVGGGWDVASSSFKTPYDGDYFFSFAAGSATSGLYLMLNGKPACITCSCDNTAICEPTRSAIMLHLITTDTITFTTPSNYITYSISDGLVKAQGFLYRLQDTRLSVAWSLVNVNVFGTVWCAYGRVGPADRVSYGTILVNVGGAWKSETSTVTIPADGTYFIDLTTYFCGTGWGGNGNPVTQLKINNQIVISLQLLNISFNGCVSRSRSIVVGVKTGDHLHVTMPSAACYFDHGNHHYQTFTGLRLF